VLIKEWTDLCKRKRKKRKSLRYARIILYVLPLGMRRQMKLIELMELLQGTLSSALKKEKQAFFKKLDHNKDKRIEQKACNSFQKIKLEVRKCPLEK
jgi:hypothetical protein